MAVFKCRCCGAPLSLLPNRSTCKCGWCGTEQSVPRPKDETQANLYDRAEHFRRDKDFDKAAGIYEAILNENPTDPEVYWGVVLCRYGIEYVENASTGKRVPTVNRTQYTSIFDDENYKCALQWGDEDQQQIYAREAGVINEIQKGILEVSRKETPFDVFICYKESDDAGRRTRDSSVAMELYRNLTRDGLKVFYSRITLEDKLGEEYEPYIFAALNTAKVMVVLGTKKEYFEAPWVRNEWSRFLTLMKVSDGKKSLIPAYQNMRASDLPVEFSHLQAQDMSRVGFLQDLVWGIEKLVGAGSPKQAPKETPSAAVGNPENVPLMKRAFLYLESGEWSKADANCERVLDTDPENAEAYLVKLMIELQCRERSQLRDCAESFADRNNYKFACRFGSSALRTELEGYNAAILDRKDQARKASIYEMAVACQRKDTEVDLEDAIRKYEMIPEWKDAGQQLQICRDRIQALKEQQKLKEQQELAQKEAIYNYAVDCQKTDTVYSLENAIRKYAMIPEWKDASQRIRTCRERLQEIKEEENARASALSKKQRHSENKAKVSIAVIVVVFVIGLAIVGNLKNVKPTQSTAKPTQSTAKPTQSTLYSSVKAGDYVTFGSYEQDNNLDNGKEPIEWLVLENTGNQLLVISRYELNAKPYNTTRTDVTWETCSLRSWLNKDFYNSAFNGTEQGMIAQTRVSADKNPECDTSPGNATIDKVFLLSIAEANNYFTSNEARMCVPTAYAKAQGAWTSRSAKLASGEATCLWWLRSPGSYQFYAARVSDGGSVDHDGNLVSNVYVCVRPALYINLGS